jgi:hypothetical protein
MKCSTPGCKRYMNWMLRDRAKDALCPVPTMKLPFYTY